MCEKVRKAEARREGVRQELSEMRCGEEVRRGERGEKR
jgi:hypothetical protein